MNTVTTNSGPHSDPDDNWLADALRLAGVGTWEIDSGSRFYGSKQCRELLGLETATSWDLAEFLKRVHPADRRRLESAIAAAKDPEVRAPLSMEYRFRHPHRGTRSILASGRVVFDHLGTPLRSYGTTIDVTGRRRAEAELEAIIRSSEDAVITQDLDGMVIDWNPAATRILGYKPDEILGKTMDPTIPQERIEEHTGLLSRVHSGETVSGASTERIRKDGTRITVLITATPICGESGEAVGVSMILKDLTEVNSLQERARQARRLESIGLVAGGVAHDFNNLLTVINGYAARITSEMPAEHPAHVHAARISQAGKRGEALTQQLLAFSRKQVLTPRVLDLNAVVDELRPLLDRLVREDVRIVSHLSPQLPNVRIDQLQLEQVLLNLVANASDAMPRGGKLTIETQVTQTGAVKESSQTELTLGTYVVLSVTDSGTGIDQSILPNVFDPFFTTKPTGEGTGLGLATVHGIVKQSGGQIAIYSEVGWGTTVRVYLPACELPVEESGPLSPTTEVELPKATETVLLVEDDPLLREYAAEILAQAGYKVFDAGDGEEALAITAQVEDLDLVITDVIMPSRNGRELVGELQFLRPDVRVLYISGYSENAISHNGILEPGVEYLQKPFTPAQLLWRARQVLGQRTRSKCVLVVDDDPGLRELLETALVDAGFEVRQADNGKAALSICSQFSVDVILLDLVMPEQEGIEALRQFKKLKPQTPVIAMSGHPDYLRPAIALGASTAFEKPIGLKALIDMMNQLTR